MYITVLQPPNLGADDGFQKHQPDLIGRIIVQGPAIHSGMAVAATKCRMQIVMFNGHAGAIQVTKHGRRWVKITDARQPNHALLSLG